MIMHAVYDLMFYNLMFYNLMFCDLMFCDLTFRSCNVMKSSIYDAGAHLA